ncbi:peptidyl-prolyl cis-trans isomerase, partial [Caldithrix abyssi]
MLVGLLIIIVLFGCQKKEELPVVARVDGKEITLQEFELSYQFNPFLSRIKQPDSAKKALLKSLIAEKLIALKGQTEQKQIADLLEAYKREAIIEAFWKEVIEPRVKIDEKELREAYFRSKTKKIVQYLLFTDAQEAERAAKLLNEGMSFEELAQLRGFDSQTILSDTIEFNGTLPAIEDQVFKMKPGEISQPVQEGFYYFILKVTGERIDLFTSENDFNARLYSLRKKLKRRKMQEAMAEYLAQNVPSPSYQISKEKIKATLQMVEKAIMAEQDNLQKNEGLTADIYNSIQRMESSLLNEPIVTFYDGQTWTIRQLLKRMAFSSYPLRMENRGLFRKSFLLALRNVLDDQVILNEAKKRNLQNSLYV